MKKPRVLIVLNEGRYVSIVHLLDRLEKDGDIETWVGFANLPRTDFEKIVKPEHRGRIRYFHETPNRFSTYADAAGYLEELAARHPTIEIGKCFAAEKYPARRFANGLPDAAHVFSCLEKVVLDERLDMTFSDYPAVAIDMFAYYLIRALGGEAFYFIQGRVGERLVFIGDLDKPKPETQALYDRYRTQSVTAEERQEAMAYLEKFRRDKVKPSYFLDQTKPRNFFNYFRRMMYYPGGLKPKTLIMQKLKRMKAKRSWRKVAFHKIDPRDKVVFFPIQYTPEASVYIRAPRFRDQAAAVSQVAMALPPGYVLYVKDHPLLKWDRDEAYYRRLLEFPNVKLMEYSTDTHDILRQARLTVTGSSTAGMESLFYGVPVLMLGGADTVYQNFKGVLKIGDMPMDKALRAGMAQTISEEDKIPMALSLLKAGMPGIFDDPRWVNRVLGEENVRNMLAFCKHWLGVLEKRQS